MVNLVSVCSLRQGERISVSLTKDNGMVVEFAPPVNEEGGRLTLVMYENQVKQLRDLLSTFYTEDETDKMQAKA
jgi:hypothetical protein